MFRLTSISHDKNYKTTFAATIEAYNYPFYGVQFHPERQIYQQNILTGYNRTIESLNFNRYFADTFIKEVRKNPNTYNKDKHKIIQHYPLIATDLACNNVFVFE